MFEIFSLKKDEKILAKFRAEFADKLNNIGGKNVEILLKIVLEDGNFCFLYVIYQKDEIYIFTDAKISLNDIEIGENISLFVCKNAKKLDASDFKAVFDMILNNICKSS